MTLASGFPAAAPHCAGPAGPEISKAVAQRCENNTKHLGQLADAVTGSEGKNLKHQYHSIGKQLHVWWRNEFVGGSPACSSGTSRKGPCRQGCNLTASQHSFEMSFLRMAVAMPHLVLHKQYQVMWSVDAKAPHKRLLEPDQPKSGWTLSDCPIDTVLLL